MAFVSTLNIRNKTSGFTHRRAVFAYKDRGGKEQYIEDIDIKFEISSAGGEILPQARIDVCNLNTDTMKYLSTITPFDNNHKVALYVGYEDNLGGKKSTILPKIFEGRIRNAMFTYIPDMWLQIYCVSDSVEMYYPVMGMQDSMEFLKEIKTVRDLLEWLQNKLNINKESYSFIIGEKLFSDREKFSFYKPLLNVEIPKFKFNIVGKNILEILREVAQAYNLTIWGDCKRRFLVVPKTNYIQDAKSPSIKWDVNVKTGMIGMPSVSVSQAEVTMLMNPLIYGGDGVNLESKLYENVYVKKDNGKSSNAIASNGKYTVTGVTHTGHLRGNEWYTKLRMVRGAW